MTVLKLSTALIFVGSIGHAACFVEYKAKKDDPLDLHYGFMELPAPCADDVESQAQARLAQAGWTLLAVQSVSETPPTQDQRDNAGEHYLRY